MVASQAAQAADTTLSLACKGTATVDATPKPISMGIILDLKAGKIDGFGKSLPAEILTVDETTLVFSATDGSRSIDGNVDRITGDFKATFVMRSGGVVSWSTTYALKCRPTQRMF